MKLKEIYEGHKKKILVTLAAGVLYVIAHFGLGLNVDFSQILEGHPGAIGTQIENAPNP